jgi:hypothetical protein
MTPGAKRMSLLTVLGLLGAVGVGSWWYFSSAWAVAEEWSTCGRDAKKHLFTRQSLVYWDEWHKLFPKQEDDLGSLWDQACLGETKVVDLQFSGRTAIAKIAYKSPDLDWKELAEFPAAATRAERVSILRKRAQGAKVKESTGEVMLRLDGLQWKGALDLEQIVLTERQFRDIDEARSKRDWKKAVSMYEAILESSAAGEDVKKRAQRQRLAALSEKACFGVVQRFIKFSDSADYELKAYGNEKAGEPLWVHVRVQAPNAFGVKSRLSGTCSVRFLEGKPNASVDVSLVPISGRESIFERNIEAAL